LVVVKEVGGGESDDPESDDEGADGEDPFADRAIGGGEGGRFAGAEDLAADADSHEENAENEGDPDHGLTFVRYLIWMRKEGFGGRIAIRNFESS
jgi:hypothetical protein